MEKKKIIFKVLLVMLLLMLPFKTKMTADPVGDCDLLSLTLLVPDDESCHNFYICSKIGGIGVFIKGKCPEGLVFDVESKVCDWPGSAENPYPCD